MDEGLIWNVLVGAFIEGIKMHKEVAHGMSFEWPEAFILKTADGKRYELTCHTDCEDGYGRMGEADFDIEEVVCQQSQS